MENLEKDVVISESTNCFKKKIPLISIITVVYNGEKFIEQTIKSVLQQTYKNVEYIIIDGGSTDNTVNIVKKYDEYISYWKSESDSGIYDAMNKGITLCNGEIIGIINSDDWYEPKTLEIIAEHYVKYPETDVFHGVLRFIKNEKEYFVRGSNNGAIFDGMFEHPTYFIKRRIYDKFGLYSLHYKSASDLDYICKLTISNVKFLFIPTIFTNFRVGGISNSQKSHLETLKIKRKYRFIGTLKYFVEILKLYIRHFTSL